jgi:hypothetical protein
VRLLHIYQIADPFHVRLPGKHPQVAHQQLLDLGSLIRLVTQAKAQGIGSTCLQVHRCLPSLTLRLSARAPVLQQALALHDLCFYHIRCLWRAGAADSYNSLFVCITLKDLIIGRPLLYA